MTDNTSRELPKIGRDHAPVRHAWVEGALASVPAGWRVLDVGAGEQRYRPACRHLQYFCQDFGGYDGVGDGRGRQTGEWDYGELDYVCDILELPVEDGSFDMVMCTEVFEHIPDPPAALREFSRVLRPGGWLLLTAPYASLVHFSPYHYYSGFSRNFYVYWMGKLGFDIKELVAEGCYYDYLAQEVRRVNSVNRQYGSGSKALKLVGALLREMMLPFLTRCRRSDRGSSELLCYGHFLLAEKHR